MPLAKPCSNRDCGPSHPPAPTCVYLRRLEYMSPFTSPGNVQLVGSTYYDLPNIPPKAILAPSRKVATCSPAAIPTNRLLSSATNPSRSRQRHGDTPLKTMEHIPSEILHII